MLSRNCEIQPTAR